MSVRRRSAAPVAALVGATVVLLLGTATATAATRGVEVRDYEYAPAAIEIVAGDTVRWSWVGDDRHSVTAPGTFDSHPDCTVVTPEACGGPGTTFAWTSSEPSTIEYGCRLHPDRMQGTITVVAAPATSPSPEPAPPPAEPPPPPAEPSPSPSPSPSASPSPSPSPKASSPPASSGMAPSPSSEDSPRPTRRSAPALGFGEASEVPASPAPGDDGGAAVAPPVVSDTSPEPLEPFPAPPSPSPGPDPVADDVVAVSGPGRSGRDAVRLAGAAAVALTALAFGRVVLFGRPWE